MAADGGGRFTPSDTPPYLPAPSNAANYGDAAFWDLRYSKEAKSEPFEWYHSYAQLAPLVHEVADPEDYILNIGCGNSRMTEDM